MKYCWKAPGNSRTFSRFHHSNSNNVARREKIGRTFFKLAVREREKKKSIVNWFYLKNAKMKAWQKAFESQCMRVSMCMGGCALLPVACVEQFTVQNVRIFSIKFIFGMNNFFRAQATHPSKQYQFIFIPLMFILINHIAPK